MKFEQDEAQPGGEGQRTYRRRSSSGPSSSLDSSDGEEKRGFVHQASAFMSRTFTNLLAKTAEIGLPHDRHETVTPDGWTLRFKHYPASETAPRKSHPVLLVHGLSANHRGYDLRKENSLAWVLRELGYNVWLIDLRGSGHSEKSRRGKKAVKWDVLAYVEDVKVGIDFLLRHHGADQVHLIGHSLGGILGLVLLGKWAEYRAKVASLTTLASALYYGDSWWAHLEPMAPLADVIDFLDTRMLMKLYSPFVVWPSFAAHMTNVKRADLQRLLNHVEKVPTGVFKDLSTSFHPDGLQLDFGDGPQRVQELMGHITCPVLSMAADFDKQCRVPSIQRTTDLLGSSIKRCVVCGPKPEYRHHYGHVDILIGRHTEEEVFPPIADFLQACDDPGYVASPKPLASVDKQASLSDEDEETAPLELETPADSTTTDEGGEGEEGDEYERLRGVMQERIGVGAGEVLSPMGRTGTRA